MKKWVAVRHQNGTDTIIFGEVEKTQFEWYKCGETNDKCNKLWHYVVFPFGNIRALQMSGLEVDYEEFVKLLIACGAVEIVPEVPRQEFKNSGSGVM